MTLQGPRPPGHQGRRVKLSQAVPELAGYISAGLVQKGRPELVPVLDALEIHALSMSSHAVGIVTVADFNAGEMMFHPNRERLGMGRPKGTPERQWVITLEVIKGRIWFVGVAHPGILRPQFRAILHDLQ